MCSTDIVPVSGIYLFLMGLLVVRLKKSFVSFWMNHFFSSCFLFPFSFFFFPFSFFLFPFSFFLFLSLFLLFNFLSVGAIKKYAWGKIGKESEVFNLFLSQTTWAEKRGHVYNQPPLSLPEDEESPFAELWITTHPSGPALVLNEENKLPHKDIMLQVMLMS